MSRQSLRLAIVNAARVLDDAGVPSANVDAELIAAHVLDVPRSKLPLTPLVDPPVVAAIGRLAEQRAKRIPLQHLTGYAALGPITVEVGRGVFIPRPETEAMLDWVLRERAGVSNRLVVDLCTGTGALAIALAHAFPDATVHAVELDANALAWARHNADGHANAGGTPIRLHAGDVTDRTLFAELEGLVDVVVCNPPYVPDGTSVPPEVADHDPAIAVFADDDGLAVIKPAIACAARLLRPGGLLAIEHDDGHGESVPALLAARRVLTDVADHPDLAGRPRFATAVRRVDPS